MGLWGGSPATGDFLACAGPGFDLQHCRDEIQGEKTKVP